MQKITIFVVLLTFGIMASFAASTVAQPRKYVTSGWIKKMADHSDDVKNMVSHCPSLT